MPLSFCPNVSVADGAVMFSLTLRGLLWRLIKPVAALFLKRLYARVQFLSDAILVQRGILVRRSIKIHKNNIKCFCVDRGPLMRILRLYTLSVIVKGETDGIDSRIIVLPVCNSREAEFVEKGLKAFVFPEKDTLVCTGERFFKKRTVLFRKREIGAVFIGRYIFSRKCSVKLILRSQKRNKVKLYGIEPQKAKTLLKLIERLE